MSLFRLDASILPATSASRSLGDLVEAEWLAAHPNSTVVRRDLARPPRRSGIRKSSRRPCAARRSRS